MARLERPVCPMCKEFGIHATTQDCLDALRAAIHQLRTQRLNKVDPSVEALGYWVPSFLP